MLARSNASSWRNREDVVRRAHVEFRIFLASRRSRDSNNNWFRVHLEILVFDIG